MSTKSDGLKIIGLQAENFKRLKAVSLKLDGKALVIGGRNEQGKSSLLDSIWVALGGKDAMKKLEITEPINKGAEKAKIVLDLGTLIVTRKWTPTEALVVENKDGATFKSPQGMLDALLGRVFDPFEFARMKEADRKELLLSLVDIGIDLDQWAEDRKSVYDERTAVNRRVKELEGQLAGMSFHKDAPREEISSQSVLEKLRDAQRVKEANDEKRRQLKEMTDMATQTKEAIESCAKLMKEGQDEIEALEAQITTIKEQLMEFATKQGQLKKSLDAQIVEGKKFYAEVQALVDPDLTVFDEELASLEERNAKVRANAKRREVEAAHEQYCNKAAGLTSSLEKMDNDKAEALLKTKFPVDGLSIDENGVTFNNLPIGQASTEEKIRVGMAIAMAMSPKLKVIRISQGESLDAEHFKMILRMAEENGYQALVETVGDPGEMGVVIENGELQQERS